MYSAAFELALAVAKWAVRLLIGLCSSTVLLYIVVTAVPAWRLSSACRTLTNITVFPFIPDSLIANLPFSKRGKYSSTVWFLWGLPFTIAILSILLRRLCTLANEGKHQHKRGALSQDQGWLISLKSMAKRVLLHQLPPCGFWFWLCNGFQVYDALVVCLWMAINLLYVEQKTSFMFAAYNWKFLAAHQDKVPTTMQEYLGSISGGLGWAATLDIMLLFYPVPRSTFLHYLLGAGFKSLIKYHRWLGHGTMVLVTLHGWGFLAVWLWEGAFFRALTWDPYGTNMLAGVISWACGAVLWVSATSYFRRKYFEVFFRTHILGFVGFIVFGFMHYTSLWAFVTPALAFYLLDVTFRLAQQAQPVRLQVASVDSAKQMAQLQMKVDCFSPLPPLQDIYICAWELSPVQWHPFTAIPGQQPSTLSSIIKRSGSWTHSLMNRLLNGGDMAVRVAGPYGMAEDTPDYLRFPVLALFAGGIGVTPVLGIIQDLTRRRALLSDGQTMWPSQAHLIFAGRSVAELNILNSSIISDARAAGWLQVQLFLTCKPTSPGTCKQAVQLPACEHHNAKAVSAEPADKQMAEHAYLRRSLPPYKFGDVHLAAAHVLCLAGAVLGGVGAWAFAAAAGFRSCQDACGEHGPGDNWLVGLSLVIASCIGSMLLPALIIIPAHLWRSIAVHRNSCGKTATADCVPDAHTLGCLPDLEQPSPPLDAVIGRPDVPALLADLARTGADHQEIGVVVAGPEALVSSVRQACSVRNNKMGLTGTPYFHPLRYTVHL